VKRAHWLSLGGVVVVLLACVAYIFGSLLRVPVAGSATQVNVEMARTGGLFVGSGVSYRGVVVGKVTALELTENGVRANVRLDPDVEIPVDSRVQVRSLSPIGEQYLDFQPRRQDGPTLRNGDTVTGDSVDLPQTVAALSVSLDRLIGQVDLRKVRLVLSELGTGLSGAEGDLQRLLADGLTVVDTLDNNVGVVDSLIADGNTVLRIGADTRGEILQGTRSAAVFTGWLRRFQPDLYQTLERAPGQIEQLRRLVLDLTDVLPGFLDAQGSLSDILRARDPHLRELLQSFPLGLEALASAINDNRVNFDLLARRGPVCDYVTRERDPRDTTHRDLQDDGRCSSSLTTYSQRGAQFAPPPNP
jgi:phospholipid/cholesterol/gamma-HCH transport system substrate-binding protein